MQDRDSFCVLPFIHAVMNPYDSSNERASILPCCRYPHKYTEHQEDIDPINKSETFKTLQDAIDNGEKLENCNHCWRDENSGVQSYRQVCNNQYRGIINDGSYREKKLRYLELMFSNTCNLACRSCSSTYSSKWMAIDKYLDSQNLETMRVNNIAFPNWRNLDLTHLTTLKLMGGEPFYQKSALELLEYLESIDVLKNLTLSIPTNCTITPNETWIRLLSSAKIVHLHVSIDAYGQLNNYIREGSEWDTILNNLTEFRIKLPNVAINVNTVVTAYNVNVLPVLNNFLRTNFKLISHYHDLAYYPSYLDIALLPNHIKDEILTRPLPHKVKEYITSKEHSPAALEQLKVMTNAIDKYHNKSLMDYNKEMYDWIYNG